MFFRKVLVTKKQCRKKIDTSVCLKLENMRGDAIANRNCWQDFHARAVLMPPDYFHPWLRGCSVKIQGSQGCDGIKRDTVMTLLSEWLIIQTQSWDRKLAKTRNHNTMSLLFMFMREKEIKIWLFLFKFWEELLCFRKRFFHIYIQSASSQSEAFQLYLPKVSFLNCCLLLRLFFIKWLEPFMFHIWIKRGFWRKAILAFSPFSFRIFCNMYLQRII